MILIGCLQVLLNINTFVFGLVPNVPPMPQQITQPIDYVITLIFNHVQLLNLFIPLDIVIVLLPLSIIVSNFSRVWSIIDWIWAHIPVFGSGK